MFEQGLIQATFLVVHTSSHIYLIAGDKKMKGYWISEWEKKPFYGFRAQIIAKYEIEEKISNKEFFNGKWILTPYLIKLTVLTPYYFIDLLYFFMISFSSVII